MTHKFKIGDLVLVRSGSTGAVRYSRGEIVGETKTLWRVEHLGSAVVYSYLKSTGLMYGMTESWWAASLCPFDRAKWRKQVINNSRRKLCSEINAVDVGSLPTRKLKALHKIIFGGQS